MSKVKAKQNGNPIEAKGWQNRITGSGVKPASQFLAHPLNWRQHPPMQREALATSLSRVGWVQQVIENTTTGHLLDGHERVWQALQADDADVPFIQVALTEDEERFVLATLDPISALAEIDGETLRMLAGHDIDLSQFFDPDELSAILQTIPDVEFKEYDESVADDVEYCTCPKCGHKFPK